MFQATRGLDRWIPAFSMLLVSLISYIDRSTLALLAPTILRETRLSGQQYGFIISAFSLAYMAANPVWGRILDRAGLRRGMTAAVAAWTVASVSHAFASGFWSFGLARAALGFGEGATFPGGLRAVVQTLPPEQRGRGLAVAYSGGSLGAVITPLIVTPIFLWWGWRSAFWFTGLIGALWLALWAVISRRPDLAYRKLPEIAPIRFTDAPLWAFMCAYALGAVPLGFILYTAALYLAHPLNCSQELIGKVLWIPPLGWETGYFFWGWLSDRMLAGEKDLGRQVGSLRRLLTICAVLNLLFGMIPLLSSVAAVMFLMFVAMFVAAGFVVLSVAYATRIYSTGHAGFIAGAGAGSWSAVVALAMPYVGHLFDGRRYAQAFWMVCLIPLFGFLGWFILSKKGCSVRIDTSEI